MSPVFKKRITRCNTEHWQGGILHREDGPAVISESDPRFGPLPYEEYWIDGDLHRDGGPAVSGPLRAEYWKNDWRRRHRVDGPALVVRNGKKLSLAPNCFEQVPKLAEGSYGWTTFPKVGDVYLSDYLSDLFGGSYPFKSLGDFGAEPMHMAFRMAAFFEPNLRFEISYERGFVDLGCDDWQPSAHPDNKLQPDTKKIDDNTPGLLDLLGCYRCSDHTIVLYIRAIAECAERLDRAKHPHCAPCAMTLAAMVFFHEMGHAIDHFRRGARPDDDLGTLIRKETLAQHFMMTAIRTTGKRAEPLAEMLEQGQPSAYQAWKTCGYSTDWDGCQANLRKNGVMGLA